MVYFVDLKMHGKHVRYVRYQQKQSKNRNRGAPPPAENPGNLIGTRPKHWTSVFTSEIHSGPQREAFCHHLSSFLLNRTQSINVRISFCRCHLHGKHDEYWQSTKNDRTGSNPVEEVVNGLETELEFLRQGRSKGHI